MQVAALAAAPVGVQERMASCCCSSEMDRPARSFLPFDRSRTRTDGRTHGQSGWGLARGGLALNHRWISVGLEDGGLGKRRIKEQNKTTVKSGRPHQD